MIIKSKIEYYLELFQGLRDKVNYLVYDQSPLKEIFGYARKDLKLFGLMVMFSLDGGKSFRWLLLNDQKDFVIRRLEGLKESKYSNIIDNPNEFFKIWINFHFGQSGLIKYFSETKKNTEYIQDFKKEEYLIGNGYEKDYEIQAYYNTLRTNYRSKINESKFDPFIMLEEIWGFKNVPFYYVKLPNQDKINFVAVFPVLSSNHHDFFKKADFTFSLVKNAVLGANLMGSIIEQNIRELYNQTLKTAIISILIDSYAHNISAHSLAALKWWIELRHKMLDKRFRIEGGSELNCLQPSSVIFNKETNEYECKVSSSIIINQTGETTLKYYEALGLKDSTYNQDYYSLFDFLQFADQAVVKNLFRFENVFNHSFHPRFPVPIDYALYPFFRFLRDKGAFWSGVTRDMAFGGESKTWYKILWEDFANNPLYLGTIAKSEGITKININLKVKQNGKLLHKGRFVTIDMSVIDYEEKLSQDPELDSVKYKKLLNNSVKDDNECTSCKDYVEFDKYSKYAFVKLGKCFAKFRNILDDEENFRVFLPGGIVGEHALFTIFENTIRNIKHYKDSDTLKNIQKNGIDFWISIEEDKLRITSQNATEEQSETVTKESAKSKEGKKPELFKIGVWLGHETELVSETVIDGMLYQNGNENGLKGKFVIEARKENVLTGKFISKDEKGNEAEIISGDFAIGVTDSSSIKYSGEISSFIKLSKQDIIEPQYLLLNIADQSLKPILDEQSGAPRMGGNSQDKACAAMLFNNKFSSVENKGEDKNENKNESKRIKRDCEYFPWIEFKTFKLSDEKEYGIKLEWKDGQKIVNKESTEEYVKNINKDDKGYLKKYFYLWRGEDVFVVSNESDFDAENISRFRFVVLDNENEIEKVKLETRAREEGVIRIMYEKLSKKTLYNRWLLKFLNLDSYFENNKRYLIYNLKTIAPNGASSTFGDILIGKNRSRFVGKNSILRNKIKKVIDNKSNNYEIIQNEENKLIFAHRSTMINDGSFCNVRSHGWFLSRLFEGCNGSETEAITFPKKELGNIPNSRLDIFEFTEAILSVVVIFDNRVFERFPKDGSKKPIKHYENKLNLSVFAEDKDEFEKNIKTYSDDNNDKFKTINFLIIHLSFIEFLEYRGEKINDFVSEQIEPLKKLSKNLILVITTGRGRGEWWEKLKPEYKEYTIFKPIESILSSIEAGVSYKDDIDIKFNLIKVLFGS